MMKDLPQTTGNVFFIYSNVAAGGAPTVRVAPSISARTGLASVTGGLDNANLTITPTPTGGFTVVLKVNQAQGFYNFSVSATTNGDATHEAATVTFTFYVVLVGSDEVFDVIRREYRVGDEVNEQLYLAPANGIHDYRVTGGGLRAMDVDSDAPEYASGITISVRTIDDADQVWLSGRAKRPGCYLAWLDCTTWDQPQYGARLFPGGGNMAAPVIVSIHDRVFEPGQICVGVDQAISHNHNALRLIMCDDNVFPAMGGWFKVRMTGGGGVWSGQHELSVYDGTEYHDYRIELSGQTWMLKTRVWGDGGETPETPPDWATLTEQFDKTAQTPCGGILATVPAITGANWVSQFPPSSGWSNGAVLTGDSWYSVAEYGLFDYKGDYQGRPVYQQQCVHTRQYAGWVRSLERQHDYGYLLHRGADGVWRVYTPGWAVVAEDVAPSQVDGALVPYAPPVVERVGTDIARDLTVGALNINIDSVLRLGIGNAVGGVWGWYDAARLIVPYNGSDGENKRRIKAKCKLREYTMTASDAHYCVTETPTVINERIVVENYRTGAEIAWSYDGELPFGQRSGAMPVLFGVSPGSNVSTAHYVSGGQHQVYKWGAGEEIDSETIVVTNRNLTETYTPNGQLPLLLVYPFAAPDAKSGKWHQCWFAARLVGGGGALTWTDERRFDYSYSDPDVPPGSDTEEISGRLSFSGRHQTTRPVRFGGEFEFEPQSEYREIGSFQAVAYTWVMDPNTSGGTITDWYELTITKNVIYTEIGNAKIGGDTNFSWTKRTRPAGVYPNELPPFVVSTGSSTEFSDYQRLVDEAKAKVAAYVAPTGDGQASYFWRDDSTVTELTLEAEE